MMRVGKKLKIVKEQLLYVQATLQLFIAVVIIIRILKITISAIH